MIKVSNLSKKIHHDEILKTVNFSIKPGTITGIVGRNGAGKTTILRLISGIIRPTNGSITIDDQDVIMNPHVKEDLIFVPDTTEMLRQYSIREIVRLYKEIYERFDENYFYELIDRFSFQKTGRINKFSKGQKALFSLMLAFSTNARYILLDEPTDGLDVIIKKQILRFIAEEVADQDVSVVISSHRLDELEKMADHIVVIKDGSVESELEMEQLKEQYRKVQVAFNDGMLPEGVRERTEVLSENGKVFVILAHIDDWETFAALKEAKPILQEELPLSLEDIFVAKLGGDVYAS